MCFMSPEQMQMLGARAAQMMPGLGQMLGQPVNPMQGSPPGMAPPGGPVTMPAIAMGAIPPGPLPGASSAMSPGAGAYGPPGAMPPGPAPGGMGMPAIPPQPLRPLRYQPPQSPVFPPGG